MRFRLLSLLFLVALYGCASTVDNTSLRPRETSNEAATANLNLGIEYMRNGNLERALERLNRAHQADPNYYATHNAYGLLYQRLGDNTLAERHFRRAIALNNNDSPSKNNLGSFLCQNGRYEEAEQIFLSAASNPLYETPEIAYANAGTCAMMNDDEQDAEKYFRQALSINPGVPIALIQMAQLSYAQENYLSARGYLQRYQSVARNTAESLLLGIRVEQQLGDRDAVSSYEMMLKNNFPDSEEIQQLRQSPSP
ncbi:MAG: type IV pilus biogenesis/stability protein PilW [Gammaproteobacteria bacterium]